MNRSIFSAAVLLALGIAACGDQGSDGAADGAADGSRPMAGDTATSAPVHYESHGTVTKIDRPRKRLTLDHEQIGDWTEPMVMPFPVADVALLDGIEVGQRYAFTVEVTGRKYRITKLTPAQ